MPETFVDFRVIKLLVSITSLLDHYRIQLRKVNQQSLCNGPQKSDRKKAFS